jgi:hypothetical protein
MRPPCGPWNQCPPCQTPQSCSWNVWMSPCHGFSWRGAANADPVASAAAAATASASNFVRRMDCLVTCSLPAPLLVARCTGWSGKRAPGFRKARFSSCPLGNDALRKRDARQRLVKRALCVVIPSEARDLGPGTFEIARLRLGMTCAKRQTRITRIDADERNDQRLSAQSASMSYASSFHAHPSQLTSALDAAGPHVPAV